MHVYICGKGEKCVCGRKIEEKVCVCVCVCACAMLQ